MTPGCQPMRWMVMWRTHLAQTDPGRYSMFAVVFDAKELIDQVKTGHQF